jgi:glycosyltransferase involved in cell wall biosynthesis
VKPFSSELISHEPLDGKVVVLTHYLPPYMSRVLFQTSRHVRELQVLLSIESEPNRAFGDTWDGLDVQVQKSVMVRVPWRHRAGFQDELYVHFPYDTYSRLNAAKPDIVFSYELGFRSLTSALYCRRRRCKLAICVCVSEHTEQGRSMLRRCLRRWLLRATDAVTYNGPSCLRYLQSFHVPANKLFHFPYAASEQFCYNGPLERAPDADYRLLYVGQLNERKGVLPMVDELAKFCRAHPEHLVELECVGTGPLETAMREFPRPTNFQMRLHGHLNYDQLTGLIEHCGLLVFPTLADEWGMVVNEAMQAGLPVLGSEFAQACETLIREGENGWLYRPDQVGQFSAKLKLALQCERTALYQMRETARATVADITPSNVAIKAREMFASLLTKPGRNLH